MYKKFLKRLKEIREYEWNDQDIKIQGGREGETALEAIARHMVEVLEEEEYPTIQAFLRKDGGESVGKPLETVLRKFVAFAMTMEPEPSNFRKLLQKRPKNLDVALGFERELDFAWGMIQGWRDAKMISEKTYDELMREFAEDWED